MTAQVSRTVTEYLYISTPPADTHLTVGHLLDFADALRAEGVPLTATVEHDEDDRHLLTRLSVRVSTPVLRDLTPIIEVTELPPVNPVWLDPATWQREPGPGVDVERWHE